AAVALWNRLIDEGLYTNIAIPPATPKALSLLRMSVSSALEPSQIDHALGILASVGAELGIIPPRASRPTPDLRVITGDASPAKAAAPRSAPRARERAAPSR
ncbi:MAG: 8-amino-7-oxononanoate synthase, partial [Pseudomonadota bacterium]